MVAGEWPPRVWHGVIDPVTGEDLPPVKLGTEIDWQLKDYQNRNRGFE